MRNANSNSGTTFDPQKVWYTRATVNLDTGVIDVKEVPCRNLEDVLGGFGRSFQMLMTRDITEAPSADNPFIINTGLLTGSNVMTGLRTYFSPIARSSTPIKDYLQPFGLRRVASSARR